MVECKRATSAWPNEPKYCWVHWNNPQHPGDLQTIEEQIALQIVGHMGGGGIVLHEQHCSRESQWVVHYLYLGSFHNTTLLVLGCILRSTQSFHSFRIARRSGVLG